jgi:hypothetical protein
VSKKIYVCVPVLKRYDLLAKLFVSLSHSLVKPEAVFVIDNGRDKARLDPALAYCPVRAWVEHPKIPLGVAESWNWFLTNVPEERVIVNDDCTFAPESIGALCEAEGDLVHDLDVDMCSCFVMRDSCIEKVGYFDEAISPGYAYFEDCDYQFRLEQTDAIRTKVVANVTHLHSQTMLKYSLSEKAEHHRKFLIAQNNFIIKWGRLPEGMQQQTSATVLR